MYFLDTEGPAPIALILSHMNLITCFEEKKNAELNSKTAFSYICFSCFTFPGPLYQIFLYIFSDFLAVLSCCNRTTRKKWVYTQRNYFLNLVKSNQIWIVVTVIRMIWHRTQICLVSNKWKSEITNQIYYDLTRFRKYFLYVFKWMKWDNKINKTTNKYGKKK